LLPGDLKSPAFYQEIVDRTMVWLSGLNILVNNAAEQNWHDSLEEIKYEELDSIFSMNIIAMFRIARAAVKHLMEGDSIINTTSVNAFKGMGCCSIILRPKGPSRLLRGRCRCSSSRKAFG